ncbi:hypothetical protein [Acetobacter orleanensis]|uniref:GMP reductase n=1 Tax=Acetobacter orleanensis TaxID=104099 RepID=A0A4Y3TLJ7_9PROT|nr:hypothetical protein [Acetobacter orleanensis]GAN69101.1 hypothetical protein Abol_026_003 [Acetobacter orleanensis JCM 7639]GBR25872.1 hypothetical protein AA0473_1004 [Acetobacter orleanensis NRIC 0473]GEB82634.1 hypothetical protein AOR01nite_11110 [Acetobacter orleanensis]
MFARNLTETLLHVLDRPELRLLAMDCKISLDPRVIHPFRVQVGRQIVLGSPCLGEQRVVAFHLRHALELAVLSGLQESDPVHLLRLSFSAARTAARFWMLDAPSDLPAPEAWVRTLASRQPPARDALPHIFAALCPLFGQIGEGAVYTSAQWEEFQAWLAQAWSLIGPVEALMAEGGDARLAVDVRTGLNHYGCSHRPRPWAVTFASSTASSLSERGFTGGEMARVHLARAVLANKAPLALQALALDVRSFLAGWFGLPGKDHVVLASSGTDVALAVLALSALPGQPVSVVLTAPEETGSGVPLASHGQHFAQETALGTSVCKGALVEGFREDTRCVALPLRDTEGHLRPEAEVTADCQKEIRDQLAQGRRVLLHVLDLSKTGLLAPDLTALEALCDQYPGQLDVVVDACQARLMPERVQAYLARGWAVMVTGSKFFTGPPFCGALLLPDCWKARLDHGALPAGLAAYANQCEWPESPACQTLASGFNHGLLLRWKAAQAEMAALSAIPPAVIAERLQSFLTAVTRGIEANPDLEFLPQPSPQRNVLPDDWDRQQTILSFLVRAPEKTSGETGAAIPLDLARCRKLYQWLNADLSPYVPQQQKALAGLLCHIGQPVPIPHVQAAGGLVGALRLSAGARLVSGEPSHEGLDVKTRMARELQDSLRVLEKISLILKYWEVIAQADPLPSYAPCWEQEDRADEARWSTPVSKAQAPKDNVTGEQKADALRRSISALALGGS